MSDTEATLSVILPVYNVAPYLARCMESLAAQTEAPAEIILVDDGSTDESGALCDRYAASGDFGGAFVRVLHQENAGASAARNAGLSLATGKWVAFIDPDDWIEPDYCAAAVRFAEETDADVVCFDGWRESEGGSRGWSQYAESFCTADRDRIVQMQCRVIFFLPRPGQPDQSLAAPWDKLYRRSFLVRERLKYTKSLAVLEDMSFNFHVFGRVTRIGYLHRRLYHYWLNAQSITHSWRGDRPAQDRKVFRYLRRCIEEQGRREAARDAAGWARRRRRLARARRLRIVKSTLIEGKLWLLAKTDKVRGRQGA